MSKRWYTLAQVAPEDAVFIVLYQAYLGGRPAGPLRADLERATKDAQTFSQEPLEWGWDRYSGFQGRRAKDADERLIEVRPIPIELMEGY